jgi:peroxiredoxin
MKKILLFVITAIFILTSCSEKPNIKIEGEIQGGSKQWLYLDFLDINKTKVIDSLKIRKDDSFKFSFYAEYPGIYILRNNKGKIINLLPSPGEELYIDADYNNFSSNYTVSGSQESEYIRQLVEKLSDTRSKINKLNESYESLTNVTEEQAANYLKQLKAINKEQRDFSIQFIIEHLSSIASIYALYQEVSEGQYVLGENFDIQYMKIVADSVSKYYPDVPFVSSFVADARNTEEKVTNLKLLQSALKTANEVDLNITLPDKDNNEISLNSLNSKAVLIYFWSSKSKESKQLNPQLKLTFDKYKTKGFQVYAVAIEDNKKAWTDAIKFDELNWINVIEKTYPDSKVATLYNVKVLPSTFLLNENGEIVARNIFGQELEKWLDNIL